MKKPIAFILIGMVVLFIACGSDPVSSQDAGKDMEEDVSMEYSEKCLTELVNIMGCPEKKAHTVLNKLVQIGAGNIEEVSLYAEDEGYTLLAVNEEGKSYFVYVDKMFHLYAVKGAEDEKYLYAEYQ